MPSTHDLFQNATTFDLLVEFFEDQFEKDPNSMLMAAKGDDGEIVFEETGDPLIDKWEKELAMGLTPDLTEGMSERDKKILENEREKKKHARSVISKVSDIDERFEQSIRKDPRYKNVLGSNDSTTNNILKLGD